VNSKAALQLLAAMQESSVGAGLLHQALDASRTSHLSARVKVFLEDNDESNKNSKTFDILSRTDLVRSIGWRVAVLIPVVPRFSRRKQ
jgi:hypothetical protein